MATSERQTILQSRTKAARALALAVACALAMLVALCGQAWVADSAYAAESSSAKAADGTSSSGKSGSSSAKADSGKSDKQSNSLSADANTKKEEEERKAKEEEAAKKRDEADKLFAQARGLNETLSKLQADRDAAQAALDDAIAQRDDAQQRLAEEKARLEELQAELSDFVIDMYKQGGVTPYLDVLVRSTSYSEFLNSWNALVLIYERGEELTDEKRAIQAQIESEISECEERIRQAERDLAIADSKEKQVRASQLSLNMQACNLNLEAAEILGDEDEIGEAKDAVKEAEKALDDAIKEGLAGMSVDIGDGIFANPCPASTVSSGFGYRDFDKSEHKGIDLAAAEGTPYYAAESGTVLEVTNGGGYNGGAGNWIVIDHGDGIVTKYMHSLVTLVQPGDHVERGQNIGLVGNTGNSTGPHLHFQVEVNGTAVDPTAFLKKKEE